jgi:hypothetical protein
MEGGRIEGIEQLRELIEADLDLRLWLGRCMVIRFRHDATPYDDTMAPAALILIKPVSP